MRRYFPAVDGLRGLAIVSVLLYHSGWSTRGLFGVDVFFVVSGFLITFLLLRELQTTGRVRIGRFYLRRARRLLPALFLTLAVVLLLVWQLGTLEELKQASSTALFSLAQIANWHQIGSGVAYWEQTGQVIPLAQMWSLSVTEQFYLLWPVLLIGIWWLGRRRVSGALVVASGMLVLAALVAPLIYDGDNADRAYLGTDTRVVAFVAGAVAAIGVLWVLQRHADRPVRAPRALGTALLTGGSLLSLVAVVTASVLTESYHDPWLYRGGLALVAVAAALLAATLCCDANPLVRFFAWKPFVSVGKVSYNLFLLHLPVYWVVQKVLEGTGGPLTLFVVGGVVTWAVAAVLQYYVTEPLRLARWRPPTALASIAVSVAMVCALALVLPHQREQDAVTAAPSVADEQGGIPEGHAGGRPLVLTVGDSLAKDLAVMLTDHGTGGFAVRDQGAGGCGIFDSDQTRTSWDFVNYGEALGCWEWGEKLRSAVVDGEPDIVLVHTSWDAAEQLVDGVWMYPCMPEWHERYEAKLDRLVELASSGAHRPRILLSSDRPSGPVVADPSRMACFNDLMRDYAAGHENAELLDWGGALCPEGMCRTHDDEGAALILDDQVHLSPAGMREFAPWLEQQLAGVLGR